MRKILVPSVYSSTSSLILSSILCPLLPSYSVEHHSALLQTLPSRCPVLRLPAGLHAAAADGSGWGVQVVPDVPAAVLLLAAREQQRSKPVHSQRHRHQLLPGLDWHSEHCTSSILLFKNPIQNQADSFNLSLFCVWRVLQLWCIITNSSGEAEKINRFSKTPRPLTICTYPEVCNHQVASD